MDKNNTITICLVVAVVILAAYLLVTCLMGNKDYYIQTSVKGLGDLYEQNYDSIPGSGEYVNFEGTNIQELANEDAIDFYHSFHNDPSRIDRTLSFQEMAINKYNKDYRYC